MLIFIYLNMPRVYTILCSLLETVREDSVESNAGNKNLEEALVFVLGSFPHSFDYSGIETFLSLVTSKIVPSLSNSSVLVKSREKDFKARLVQLAKYAQQTNKTSLFTRKMQSVKSSVHGPLSSYVQNYIVSKPVLDSSSAYLKAKENYDDVAKKLHEEAHAPVLVRCRQLEKECNHLCMLMGLMIFPFTKLCQELRAERATIVDVVPEDREKYEDTCVAIMSTISSKLNYRNAPPKSYKNPDVRKYCGRLGCAIPKVIGRDGEESKKIQDFLGSLSWLGSIVRHGKVRGASSQALETCLSCPDDAVYNMMVQTEEKSETCEQVLVLERDDDHSIDEALFTAIYKDWCVRSEEFETLKNTVMHSERMQNLREFRSKLDYAKTKLDAALEKEKSRLSKNSKQESDFENLKEMFRSICIRELNQTVLLVA